MQITLTKLLEELPPGIYKNVSDVLQICHRGILDDEGYISVKKPELNLHCDYCNGIRLFEHNQFEGIYNDVNVYTVDTWVNYCFIEYLCQNCKVETKKYCLTLDFNEENFESVDVIKVGEYPFFGPRISSKLISLIGPDRELFLKGRKCESQNLGIASYSYYRRVVENQRNRLIDKIISVCKKIDTEQDIIDNLNKAKKDIQFSNSIESIKGLIPKQLFIQNVNPMKLLHKALSIGIHNLDDKECLEYAKSIRVILTEFSSKLNEVLRNHKEINEAIKKLNNLK